MKGRQTSRGVTLIIVLIFLVIITLFSVSAFRASTTNLRITQNMEFRQEAIAAAQAAVEQTISTPAFHAASAAAASTVPVDVDGNGIDDYNVTVRPADACARIRPLRNAELPRNAATGLPQAAWIRCDSGQASGSGAGGTGLIEGGAAPVATGLSYCVETHWNVQAVVADEEAGVSVELNQGVAVPFAIDESTDRCQRNN